MKTFLLIASWIIVAWIAYRTGRNSGYNLGYDRGYHQCCGDYNLYDKEGISRLEYFQDRDFEVKTGIHQARQFEKALKGEESIEDKEKKYDEEILEGTLLSLEVTSGDDLLVFLLPNILKTEGEIWPSQKFLKETLNFLKIQDDPEIEAETKMIADKIREKIEEYI